MSKLPFELLIALRYLRPKRTFVSIITLISVLGVMLGVAVLIIVISVMSGFDKDLRDRVFGFNAHITVRTRGRTMENYAAVASVVSSNANVKGVTPFVLEQVAGTGPPRVGADGARAEDGQLHAWSRRSGKNVMVRRRAPRRPDPVRRAARCPPR